MSTKTLIEAFKQTEYQVAGHGPRNIGVLKEALNHIDDSVNSDIYGAGNIIDDFQEKMANFLGKESAVFFPSGTMAQQIALRIWCDEKTNNKIAYHPLSHLEIHEEDGPKLLHGLEPVLLADQTRVITLNDVMNIDVEISSLLLELPQREIGGQLPEYETLVAISNYCREKQIRLHLDGARLYEILPYYGKTAEEICQLFDSVYISFYKGIGGIAGAILAGGKDFIKEAKVWKRRQGGDLISLYPYIISADYYFDKRISKMEHYYQYAQELAASFNECHALIRTRPEQPVSNMFHVHFDLPKAEIEPILVDLYETTGVGLTGNIKEISDKECYSELSMGDVYENIPKETLQKVFKLLNEKLSKR